MRPSDPVEELREELQRESAASDAKLRQFIREDLTEERLHEDWDCLRGTNRVAAPSERTRNAWHELLSAWTSAREEILRSLGRYTLRVAVPVAALVVVGLVMLNNVTPSGFVVPADPGDRAVTPGQANLPDHVRVDFKRGEIEFFGDGDKLAGTLTALTDESTRDIVAFHASVKGKDSTGVGGSFEGRVLFTRSASGKAPQKKADITKILVTGELRVTGAGAFQINRTYLP